MLVIDISVDAFLGMGWELTCGTYYMYTIFVFISPRSILSYMALWSFLIGIRRLARVQDASTSTRAVQIPERRGDKTHQDQNNSFPITD